MKILIDNGHGVNTAGKKSPDKQLLEYKYNREIAIKLVAELKAKGYDAERIVTEDTDISMGERCRRVNAICNKIGTANVILISVHVNAAGSGGVWRSAGGWCAYTTRGVTKSDAIATKLYEAAKISLSAYAEALEAGKKTGLYDSKQRPFRTDYQDGDADQEADFYIIKNTKCPAVLTENLFMDNKTDMAFLLSEAGRKAIVDLHVNGIINYIKSVK